MPDNSNPIHVSLIPKLGNVDTVQKFISVSLSNFYYKIIAMILANRLSPIIANIISPQQSTFIKGRNLSDSIITTSECMNILDNKFHIGDMALIFDIIKAFDTLNLSFLLSTLRVFGFSKVFIGWIKIILELAKLSILVNFLP